MKRSLATLLALSALVAAGCGAGTDTAPKPPRAEAPTQPATPPTGPSLAEWNDKAFRLIKEERWPEAIEAAQKAISIDSRSSAAHFNLGRAYLGAGQAADAGAAFDTASRLTNGANADVEYFRGQAKVAAKLEAEAIQIWVTALEGPLPGDAEISAALQEALKMRDEPITLGDVDGDGKVDLLRVNADRLRITAGTGSLLYDEEVMSSGLKEIAHGLRLVPQKEGPPVIHLEIPACPYAPQNAFYWFDREAKKVRPVEGVEGPCSFWTAGADGRFVNGVRAGGIYLLSVQQFEQGQFKEVGRRSRLMWPPRPDQVGYYLSMITEWPLEEPAELFASPEVITEFQARVQGGWRLGMETIGTLDAHTVQLKATKDGKDAGLVTLSLQEEGNDGGVKILNITWP